MPEQLNQDYPKNKKSLKRSIWYNLVLMFVGILTLVTVIDMYGISVYPRIAGVSCRANTALVMGAAQYNGVPSPVFMNRLEKAHELYSSGCVNKIIVTGGKLYDDNYSEGETGFKYLTSVGIPKENIKYETESKTSYENILYSKPLINENNIIIVSDDYHVYRSKYIARLFGYKVEVAPVFRQQGHLQNHRRGRQLTSELFKLMAYHFGVLR